MFTVFSGKVRLSYPCPATVAQIKASPLSLPGEEVAYVPRERRTHSREGSSTESHSRRSTDMPMLVAGGVVTVVVRDAPLPAELRSVRRVPEGDFLPCHPLVHGESDTPFLTGSSADPTLKSRLRLLEESG